MSKSARLLHLDPWAAAIAKREQAKANALSDAQADAQTPRDPVRPSAQIPVRPAAQSPPVLDAQPAPNLGAASPPSDAQPPKKKHVPVAQPPNAEELGAQIRNRLGAQKSRDRTDGRVRHHVRLSEANSQRFVDFCLERKISMQDFLELAGAHFLECLGAQKLLSPDAQTPHDDLKIFKTREDIIRLYTTYTGNRWKLHDDEAAHQFNGADLRYLEIGILNTLLNFKGKRINSFKYFVPEIEEALAVPLGDETAEILLKRRRQQWSERKK